MNTVNLIFIFHFSTGEDNIAKIRNIPVIMKQNNNMPKIIE
jgi:hypothetical protein